MKNRIQRTRNQKKQDPKDQRSDESGKLLKKKKQYSTNHGKTKLRINPCTI